MPANAPTVRKRCTHADRTGRRAFPSPTSHRSPDIRVPAFPTPAASQLPIAYDRSAADPLGRILTAYDRAIRACESFDRRASREAIGTLRHALELDTPEARSFDSLYKWCEESVERHDYVAPARCLRTLRDAWHRAAQPRPIVPRADLPVS